MAEWSQTVRPHQFFILDRWFDVEWANKLRNTRKAQFCHFHGTAGVCSCTLWTEWSLIAGERNGSRCGNRWSQNPSGFLNNGASTHTHSWSISWQTRSRVICFCCCTFCAIRGKEIEDCHINACMWCNSHKFVVNCMGNCSVSSFMCIGLLSLRFNGHFPGEPGLAGVYWS